LVLSFGLFNRHTPHWVTRILFMDLCFFELNFFELNFICLNFFYTIVFIQSLTPFWKRVCSDPHEAKLPTAQSIESYETILKKDLEDSDEPGGTQKMILDFVCYHSLESLEFIEEFFSAHKYNCTFVNSTHSSNGFLCCDCKCCNICEAEKITVMTAKIAHSHFKLMYENVTEGLVWSKSQSELWKYWMFTGIIKTDSLEDLVSQCTIFDLVLNTNKWKNISRVHW